MTAARIAAAALMAVLFFNGSGVQSHPRDGEIIDIWLFSLTTRLHFKNGTYSEPTTLLRPSGTLQECLQDRAQWLGGDVDLDGIVRQPIRVTGCVNRKHIFGTPLE